ncbi:UdgX family uracil-DNA binding protein [Pseudooceanicola nitratireducens]|uniref:UdgX family uracil-DNA binding protein n=1 Tax=Pseudooceanicola nitratireducens TaxID=517719 RepID=UPI001C97545D|nr:UdgX family uracil-DNA binding protein [Pseudooceanicola nitratireducens]MBY6164816.1 UdgX family uracil-DNA binding protein [Pseudooceanicola nitratireducens]
MQTIALPRIGTAQAWRDAARRHLSLGTPPEDLLWAFDAPAQTDLFGSPEAQAPTPSPALTMPRAALDLADRVVWHADPQRFARLYAFFWRLKSRPGLIRDTADPDLIQLRQMEKNTRRCAHKMKAFVRFRDIAPGTDGRRRFAAWFEPTHHTVEPTAPFFARRFADMDWMIVTPDVTARFEDGVLRFSPGSPRPDLPEDATEELWGTYFCNIFNPARVKISAMTSEMPRKYWHNMPEAKHIPRLIAEAEARTREMAERAPSLPPVRAAAIRRSLPDAPVQTMDALRVRAVAANETQDDGYGRIILGEGPQPAPLMVIGEQPGDVEDQQGRPFVGPAGQMFDSAAQTAGLPREACFVTNAVKRFRYTLRGKRRLHHPPDRGDIAHGIWWLEHEIALTRPRLILAMGGTAALALTGRKDGLLTRRGGVEETAHGPVLLTLHPAYILRLPNASARAEALDAYTQDLAKAAHMTGLALPLRAQGQA